ncbi:MAG: prepilin peptidase [Synergistales bacterium]|nr:prepilin peptidase [Synergistales bacterium]
MVECIGGAMGGIMAWRWGIHPSVVLALITSYLLLLNSITDLNTGYIYDLFTLILGVSGLAFRLLGGITPVLDGLLGGILGFSVIALIIVISRGGMGWGDANLMAGLGAALGWKLTAVSLYLGFMTGGMIAVVLLVLKIVKRKDAIPLGPFLAAGGIMAMVFGSHLISCLGLTPDWPWY